MLPFLPPAAVQEFEVIVARGARTGELDVGGLHGCVAAAFGQLSPGEAAAAREGLAAMARGVAPALQAACRARHMHLVPHTASGQQICWLDAAQVQIACPGGLSAVLDVACAWLATALQDAQIEAGAAPNPALAANLPAAIACQIHLDPVLSPERAQLRGERRGRALLAALAERGLAGRPWACWLGPALPVDLLSPYLAELGPALLAWDEARGGQGQAKPVSAHSLRAPSLERAAVAQAAGTAQAHAPRADVAALAQRLGAERPALQAERDACEHDHGIYALELGQLPCHLVDLARTHPRFVDASVGPLPAAAPWASPQEAPVLVSVDWAGAPAGVLCDPAREAAAMVQQLLMGQRGPCLGFDILHPGLLEHPSATTALLRALAAPSKVSQLTLAAPAPDYLPALGQQLACQGDTAVVGVAVCAAGVLAPTGLQAQTAPGPAAADGGDRAQREQGVAQATQPTCTPRPVGRAALGTLLAEVLLAARQNGLLGRAQPFHYALYEPGRGMHGVAAMAALMLAPLLTPAAAKTQQAAFDSAAEAAGAQPNPASVPTAAATAGPRSRAAAPAAGANAALPARPTPPRGRGPLIRV